jgi:hypothetical protein
MRHQKSAIRRAPSEERHQKSAIRRAPSEERHQKSAIRTSRDGKFKMASLNKRTTTKQKKGFAGVSPGEAHKVGDNLLSR